MVQVDPERQQHGSDQHCDAEQEPQDVVVDRDEDEQAERHPDVRADGHPFHQHLVGQCAVLVRLPAGHEDPRQRADDDSDLRFDRQRHQRHREQCESESGHDLHERSDEYRRPNDNQLGGGHEHRF